MTIVSIAPKQRASEESIEANASLLRKRLSEVERGEIDGLLLVVRGPGGEWLWDVTGDIWRVDMVGRLASDAAAAARRL